MSRLMLKPLKSFYGPIIAPKPIRHSPSLFHSYVNEPYHPIPGKKPKLVSAEEAVSVVKSGDSVFIQGTSATPLKLASALTTHGKASKLKDVRIHHILVSGDCEYNNKDCEGIFRSDSMFVGANCREAINDGRADFTPIFFSDFPKVFYQEIVRPDVALVQVTPADPHGYHSLGTSIDCTRAALQHAKYIIGQVNDRMPRTQGDASIHTSHFDALVEARVEMPEVPPKPLTDVEKSMGKYIAENLVEDGSTMQMGIGSIPDAVLDACSNHKNLGVHSEMFSDGLVDLVEKGVVTNNNKVIEQGKIVASFVIGTRKVFDFMHDNPFLSKLLVESILKVTSLCYLAMRIPEFVNNQFIIAQNPKVVAINSCIEIDLVGNVAADTIGPKIFSGWFNVWFN